MKPFRWVAPLLFLLLCGSAFADTLIFLVPNDGTGDNFGVIQRGGGETVVIGGGVPFAFFHTDGYAPGTTLGGGTDIFFSNGTVDFGGNSHDLAFLSGPGTLILSSFTLPTNGKTFTVTVEADIAISATIVDTGQSLDVSGGRLEKITFHFFDGLYFADSRGLVATPEPGTLGLMGMGLISMLAVARKRLGNHAV